MLCISFSVDIDECSEGNNNCSANGYCTNTVGSYKCSCNIGYLDEGLGYVCTGKYVYMHVMQAYE